MGRKDEGYMIKVRGNAFRGVDNGEINKGECAAQQQVVTYHDWQRRAVMGQQNGTPTIGQEVSLAVIH